MSLTINNPPNVRSAMNSLHNLNKNRRDFYEDPMTQECGCGDDFSEDFDRKERSLAAYIVKHSKAGARRFEYAMGILEQWMP